MGGKYLARQFGDLVRELRRERGFSQEKFATLVGVHRTYMGAIERGEKTVTIETASKIAHALNMPVSGLFLRLEKSEKPATQ